MAFVVRRLLGGGGLFLETDDAPILVDLDDAFLVDERLLGVVGQLERDAALGQPGVDALELVVDDLRDLLARERLE